MTADALHRNHETKFANAELTQISTDGVFYGYASLFGQVDMGRDAVAMGAFGRALAKKGPAGVRMLFQHNPDMPIGTWLALREDDRGLKVSGQLALNTPKGREVYNLLKAGAIDGLSIGFKTVRAKSDAATGVRTILEADLWEISIVTFPMLPTARVEQVKSARLPTIREFERLLTREAGLTRSQAKRAVSIGYAGLVEARDASFDQKQAGFSDPSLAARIRAATHKIQTT